MIGILILGKFDPSGVLVGFGIFAIVTGSLYRLPIPVQPMKLVAALAIAGGMSAAAVTASGLLLGLSLLALGASGLIGKMNRLVPRTVLLGIQLGLGVHLMIASVGLAGDHLIIGLGALGLLAVLQATSLRSFGCFLLLAAALIWVLVGGAAPWPSMALGWYPPSLIGIDSAALPEALETAFWPQLALTVTNAVLLTAAVSADYFPAARNRVTPQRLAMSSGALNLLLAPIGALPMCHGAGGLAAQYHQGARSGLAPMIFGGVCLLLGLLAGPKALGWLLLVPIPVVAALLAYAGFQLADLKRLTQVSRSCLAIIGLTAMVSVLLNPAVGLFAGLGVELLRSSIGRLRQPTM